MSDTPEQELPALWPVVVPNDDGIRPAGSPDRCFYCNAGMGEPHGRECAVVTKRVRVRYSFEIEIEVPHHWDEQMVLFHRNDSSWCADNALAELEAITNGDDCLCNAFQCEYIGVSNDTPTRTVRPPSDAH